MSIQQFMNNNDYVKSNVSQYIGAESLKNVFTNEVLKEYNEIVYTCGLLKKYRRTGSTCPSTIFKTRVIVNYMHYNLRPDVLYSSYHLTYNKKYKLYMRMINNKSYMYLYNVYLGKCDIPPSVILQNTYFD